MKTFKYIYGILKELENEPSTKKKVEILKSYNHNIGFKRFKDFLFLALRHDFRYNLKKLPKTKELKSKYLIAWRYIYTKLLPRAHAIEP